MKTVSVKNTRRAEMRAATERFRAQHHRALETLRAPACELSGIQLWRKCVQLERLANAGAVAYCNGDNIRIVWPLFGPRDYDFKTKGGDAWQEMKTPVFDCIRNIFGHIPAGVFLNADARGHTIKLDGEKVTIPDGMQTDWGRDGILAAQIDNA